MSFYPVLDCASSSYERREECLVLRSSHLPKALLFHLPSLSFVMQDQCIVSHTFALLFHSTRVRNFTYLRFVFHSTHLRNSTLFHCVVSNYFTQLLHIPSFHLVVSHYITRLIHIISLSCFKLFGPNFHIPSFCSIVSYYISLLLHIILLYFFHVPSLSCFIICSSVVLHYQLLYSVVLYTLSLLFHVIVQF